MYIFYGIMQNKFVSNEYIENCKDKLILPTVEEKYLTPYILGTIHN